MTVSAFSVMTFTDLLKMMTPDGRVSPVVEILNATNDGILDYLSFIEGNRIDGHQHQVRSGLPTVTRGRINAGVVATKGDTVQVIDRCAELESMSEISRKLIDMAPDPAVTRMNYDRPHIEAMNQQFFDDLFYGDETVTPTSFTGLTPRYSNPLTAANRDNIIDGSGGATLTGNGINSIWLINWSPTTCTGIVPMRATPSLQVRDLGARWLDDDGSGTGARIEVYATYFQWKTGLAIPDWRYVVRIANLQLSQIADDGSYGPYLPYLMKDAIERCPSLTGRTGFYMSRRMMGKLRKQVAATGDQSFLTEDMVGGISSRKRLMFDGIPVFRVDALAKNEAFVPFV